MQGLDARTYWKFDRQIANEVDHAILIEVFPDIRPRLRMKHAGESTFQPAYQSMTPNDLTHNYRYQQNSPLIVEHLPFILRQSHQNSALSHNTTLNDAALCHGASCQHGDSIHILNNWRSPIEAMRLDRLFAKTPEIQGEV